MASLIVFQRSDGEFKFDKIVKVPDTYAPNATSLQVVKNLLFVGICGYGYQRLNEASVRVTDGQNWRKIEGTSNFIGCYCLKLAIGGIFVGMYSPNDETAILYINGNSAKLIGLVEPCGDFYAGTAKSIVESMSTYKNQLFVSLSRHMSVRSLGEVKSNYPASIWIYDGKSWRPALPPTIPREIAYAKNFNATYIYRDKLVFSSGSCVIGDSEASIVRIWMLDVSSLQGDTGKPACIAGGAVAGGWDDAEIWNMNKRGLAWIYSLGEFQGDLVATMSFGNGGGVPSLWRGKPLDL